MQVFFDLHTVITDDEWMSEYVNVQVQCTNNVWHGGVRVTAFLAKYLLSYQSATARGFVVKRSL